MALDREFRRENQQVAGWLLHYHDRKAAFTESLAVYEESAEAGAYAASVAMGDRLPIQSNTVGNTTANRAAKLASHSTKLDKQRAWLELVEEIEAGLAPKMRLLLQVKRQYRHGGAKGRPVRTRLTLAFCELVTQAEGKTYEVGLDVVDQFWRRIVEYTARKAAKRGLI